MNKKKIILYIIVFFVVFITVYYSIDGILYNKEKKKLLQENEAYIRINYLLIDSKKVPNPNYDDPDTSSYLKGLVNNYSTIVKAEKKGNYYYAYAKNINSKFFEKEVEHVTFAYNDVSGNVIDDGVFENDSRLIKIPASYFNSNNLKGYKNTPVKVELINRLSPDKYNNISIPASINRIIKGKKKIYSNNINSNPKLTIFDYKTNKRLSKKDFYVCINNCSELIDEKNYTYDSSSGTITFDYDIFYMNDVKVRIKKIANIKRMFSSLFKVDDVKAAVKLNGSITLSSGASLSDFNEVNGTVTVSDYYYNGGYGSCSQAEIDSDTCAHVMHNGNIEYTVPADVRNAAKTISQGEASGAISDFYLKIPSFSASVGSGKNKKTITVSFSGGYQWVLAYCSGAHYPSASPSTLTLSYSIDVTNNVITFDFESTSPATTQTATGKFSVKASLCSIKIKKYHWYSECNEANNYCEWEKKNIRFRLYESECSPTSDSCKDMIDSKKTNADGVITFTNLECNTDYWVKEIYKETTDSSISKYNYDRDANCDGTVGDRVKKVRTGAAGSAAVTFKYCNKAIRYGFIIKKNDSHNTSLFIRGASFSISPSGRTGTTGDDGTIKVCGLTDYDDYTITETSPPPNYYATNPNTVSISKSNLYKYNVGGTCNPTASVTKSNPHHTYCTVVKKVDAITGQPLAGAVFEPRNAQGQSLGLTMYNSDGENAPTKSDGLAYFFTGEDNSTIPQIAETQAPKGYAIPDPLTNVPVDAVTSIYTSRNSGSSTTIGYCPSTVTAQKTAKDSKNLLNWYKETEKGQAASGAEFTVSYKNGNTTYYLKPKAAKKDYNDGHTTKNCYEFDSAVTTTSSATTLVSDANGEVCITGIDTGNYTISETKPARYHTFDGTTVKTPVASTIVFKAKAENNKFVNRPTEFEFNKKVKSETTDAVLKALNTFQLKKLRFNIYNSSNQKMFFIKDPTTGEYVYHYTLVNNQPSDINTYDLPSGTDTADIALDDSRNFKLTHLPTGNYTIKEVGGSVNNGTCTCNDTDCIAFFFPDGNVATFTITNCSSSYANSTANNSTGGVCAGIVSTSKGIVKASFENVLTELTFTKKDFYSYDTADDIADVDAVEFVDEKERSDFDGIEFQVKDGNTVLRFIKEDPHITDSSNECKRDSDYNVYRYIPEEYYNTMTEEQKRRTTTVLHTCGGHLKVMGLCRNKTYTIEEISVPENSVFVLEKDDQGNNPSVSYKIPCCEGPDTTPPKTTHTVIKDKGTRVRFEKRDSKYNYLIPDADNAPEGDLTTFQVYQCEKDTECHPTDNISDMAHAPGVRRIMKFVDRAYLTQADLATPLDEEDGINGGSVTQHKPSATDTSYSNKDDYELSYEVYKAATDTDISKGGTFVTNLHPDHGVLILRYLPAGYNYVLVETNPPKGYQQPSGRMAETPFTVTNQTVKVEEVNVPNQPISLLVRKYNEDGSLLAGTTFTISKAKNCNSHIEPQLVPTTGILTLKTIRDGVYELRDTGDTTEFKTCTDRADMPCNQINSTLTHTSDDDWDNYTNTVGDFERLVNDRLEKINIVEGEALIQYLERNTCYIIEEIKAPAGYSLPEKEKDRFSMIKITDEDIVFDTYKEFINKPTPFTFFKLDEYNKALDGGKYKLQKLNDQKKYVDVPVKEEVSEETGETYYKVDKDGTDYLMATKNGKATIYYLEEGQYRVLEVEAPPGYELPKKTMNVVTFFVDNEGRVYGSSIIANKPATEKKVAAKPKAQAKFIITVNTGQKIVRYGLIITVIVLTIAGLLYLQRKGKK